MDMDKAALVVCVTLFVVIGINAAIYTSLRKNKGVSQVELFRRAFKTSQQPWKGEDDSLQELSNLVSEYKNKPSSTNTDNQS